MDASRPPMDAATDSRVPDPDTGTDSGEDAAASEFSVRFRGDELWLSVRSARQRYYQTCTAFYRLERRDGAMWRALVDERPDGARQVWGPHGGYYLDDRFVQPELSLGCDELSCDVLREDFPLQRVVEYLQIGMRAPPDDAEYGPSERPDSVPVIETRAVHGALRLRLTYSTGSDCPESEEEAFVEFEVPERGVCCPIGDEGCNQAAAVGGWAPDEASCRDGRTGDDLAYTRVEDARGCPVLVVDYDLCCACQDAGL